LESFEIFLFLAFLGGQRKMTGSTIAANLDSERTLPAAALSFACEKLPLPRTLSSTSKHDANQHRANQVGTALRFFVLDHRTAGYVALPWEAAP
jgi:hypothetical protein